MSEQQVTPPVDAPPPAPVTLTAEPVTPAPPEATGTTLVEREVVEKIAAAAARSVPGVADLGGDVSRFLDSMLDRIGLDEVGDATRGVRAVVNGTEAEVTVVLVIDAEGVVPDITSAVRTEVAQALQKYGLTPTAIHIKVDDITTA